jgi:hypothetical protein
VNGRCRRYVGSSQGARNQAALRITLAMPRSFGFVLSKWAFIEGRGERPGEQNLDPTLSQSKWVCFFILFALGSTASASVVSMVKIEKLFVYKH